MKIKVWMGITFSSLVVTGGILISSTHSMMVEPDPFDPMSVTHNVAAADPFDPMVTKPVVAAADPFDPMVSKPVVAAADPFDPMMSVVG